MLLYSNLFYCNEHLATSNSLSPNLIRAIWRNDDLNGLENYTTQLTKDTDVLPLFQTS